MNLADLFELVAAAAGVRTAMVTSERRLTFAELDARANRLAHHLAAAGVGTGDHIGLQLLNGTEYIEGMLAAFKIRAVPINVNYRYVEKELAYLFDDADLVALIYHRQFGPRVAVAAAGLDGLRHLVVVEDGSGEEVITGSQPYEDALDASSPERPPGERSGDDHYIAYTGGTTGMPKGVVWRHEDIFFAAMGGGDPFQLGNVITRPEEIAERLPEAGMVSLPTPPFMHVSAHWGAFQTLFGGGKLVLPPGGRFEPAAIWELVGAEKVNVLVIVGDAMARPLLDALGAAAEAGRPYDTSSLFVVGSGGAILSASSKERLAALLPNVMVVDGFGSSETGVVGTNTGEGARFTVNDQTQVLDEAGRPVAPGSGAVGRLARRGHVPVGYYKDEAKTAATFVVVDGVRWVLPGDMATVDSDGTVVLLGRGSVSINTGGEKVYPEEVEGVLKSHPDILDAVVVGVPDERWGERVVAVVTTRPGSDPTLEDVQGHARQHLAGYKVPRQLCPVDEMVRSPAGKADYRWARETAANLSEGTPRR
ncbi:MAG TPA: acyl-CoA synthetase [Acidimicrobiales bacterium]|jgi:acyl-CoA synthetase (AMP-forming)/AMP-acid ligase II